MRGLEGPKFQQGAGTPAGFAGSGQVAGTAVRNLGIGQTQGLNSAIGADVLGMNLRDNDFSTSSSIVAAINKKFGDGVAQAIDGTSISVRPPQDLNQRVSFMGLLENIEVTPSEPNARVVINSRTGTVVINRAVRVTAAAVSHGTISVAITATNEVSQPNPLSQGQTQEVQNADIAVNEPKNPMFLFKPGVDLREIVDAVNQVGATPSSLIAILEALKSAGSLRADLLVI